MQRDVWKINRRGVMKLDYIFFVNHTYINVLLLMNK